MFLGAESIPKETCKAAGQFGIGQSHGHLGTMGREGTLSGKAAAYLCSTSIVHHRCPTMMAGSSSAVGSCMQNSSCAAQGWHSLADGIRRTCLPVAMSTADHFETAIVRPCPGVFGSQWCMFQC